MFFQKISILALLVTSTIYTSESRHHVKRHINGCPYKPKPGTTGKPNDNIGHDSGLDESNVSNGGYHQNRISIHNFQPHIITEGNIHVNPLNFSNSVKEPGNGDMSVQPHLAEKLLKKIWLSHQLANVHIPNHGQYPNSYSETRGDNSMSQSQAIPYEDYYKGPNNNVKLGISQNIEPSKITFPSEPLLKQQFLSYYTNSELSNSNEGWRRDDDSTVISPEELNHNFKNSYDLKGIDNLKISPPLVIPLAEYGVENEQEKYPPYSYYPYKHYDYNFPHRYDNSKQIPNVGLKRINNLQNKFSTYPEMNVNFDYNIPYNYKSRAVPNEEFELSKQNYLPVYQKNTPHENYDQGYDIPAAHIAPNRMPPSLQESGKFGKWVLEQIMFLNNKEHGVDKVDWSGLGFSILKILSENGMYITESGMLVDTYGTTSNIQTLNLTPIIIGNTISLRHLLEGKYKVTPSKVQKPYLRAILVSATQPLKILGIMPLGTTYLPISAMDNGTNVWENIPKITKLSKSSENIDVDEKELTQDEPKKLNIDQSIKSNHDDEDLKYSGQSSYNVKEDGNHNSIRRFSLINIIPAISGLTPKEETNDDLPYSKIVKPKPISQEESEYDEGRFFIPHIEFHEQPIDILTTRTTLPVAIVPSKHHELSRIHMPSISSLLNIAFRSTKKINNKSKLNNIVSKSPESLAALPDDVGRLNDITLAPKNLNLKEDLPVAVGAQVVPNRRFQIVADSAKPILKLKKKGLQTIPLDYTDINDTLGFESPVEELDIRSRTGSIESMPEIPPNDANDNNNAFYMAENDDDDDGDFRIIGGNAATGSGTPLSNKGRSGFVF